MRLRPEGARTEGHLHLAFLGDHDWAPVGVCLVQDSNGRVTGSRARRGVAVDDVRRQTARILSLDIDGREWPEVAKRDRVVARLQKMFPGFRPVDWSDAYEAAAWSLISSRIATRQAQGIKERMCRELGASVDIHGHRLYCFPRTRGAHPAAELQGFVRAQSRIPQRTRTCPRSPVSWTPIPFSRDASRPGAREASAPEGHRRVRLPARPASRAQRGR